MGTDDDEEYAVPVGNGGVDGGGLLPPRTDDRPRIVLSASRPPAFADAVAEAVGGDLVPLGSAGAKAAAVVRSYTAQAEEKSATETRYEATLPLLLEDEEDAE